MASGLPRHLIELDVDVTTVGTESGDGNGDPAVVAVVATGPYEGNLNDGADTATVPIDAPTRPARSRESAPTYPTRGMSRFILPPVEDPRLDDHHTPRKDDHGDIDDALAE